MDLPEINLTDRNIYREAAAAWRRHIKPPRGLGLLEDIAAQLAAIQNTTAPRLQRKRVVVFCGDHGVVAEGVSALTQGVTRHLIDVTLRGGSAISIFCRQFGIDLQLVDVGVNGDVVSRSGLVVRHVDNGTRNIRISAAMSAEQFYAAFRAGQESASNAADSKVSLLGIGEIGIGNTTSASALMSALLGLDPVETVGRGSGISGKSLAHKRKVVRDALNVNSEFLGDPQECLRVLGGFEIVAMAGAILTGAHRGMAIVVDGFTSSVAALAALQIYPNVKDYLFFSHLSGERGHKVLLKAIGKQPILRLGMRLGEGTGAALCIPLIELSCKLLRELDCF